MPFCPLLHAVEPEANGKLALSSNKDQNGTSLEVNGVCIAVCGIHEQNEDRPVFFIPTKASFFTQKWGMDCRQRTF